MRSLLLLLVVSCLSLVSSVQAQSVDILFQGDTYTAPFYQGRALWSKQSIITLSAIPQGLGAPASLYYLWSKNGTVLGNISGVGKSNMSYKDTLFSKPTIFKVEILNNNDELLAENQISLTPVTPVVLVYENNPLYGFMFHREVASAQSLGEGEATFAGFPFFFSAQSRSASNLTYKWSTNTGISDTRNSVTYRAPDEGGGTARVTLSLSNTDTIAQAINKSFLIQFGNEE